MANLKWWQTAVFYQIYPRSFADGNGDGIGDFSGIIEKLDYLKSLGIDALWISPHFPSPQFDCGYDISDYVNVEPQYGNLEQFKHFLEEAHQRGIRVVLDLVLNHTSDKHQWFIDSASSRDNPKRDWYVWRDGKDGAPPNNWYSTFGGSAWEYDEKTDAYYYHFFFKQQPDLNWRNPEVKQAMFDAVRFWLDMGVDGYRLDAIGTIYEDEDIPDHAAGITQEELIALSYDRRTSPEEREKIAPIWEEMFRYQHDRPGVHELMQELRAVIDEYEDRVLVGETDDISFYGSGEDELHLVFNFPLMHTRLLNPAWVRANQTERLALLPQLAWPCNTLGNHDSPRMYNRFGDGEHDDAIARQNLVLLLALKGTPFLYNGEEIGMTDYRDLRMDQFRDLLAYYFAGMAKRFGGLPDDEILKIANETSRDKNRTPTQWANLPNAGFSPEGVETWLPVNPNYASGVNVADQENDPNSLLHFYRSVIAMRKANPALAEGAYQPLEDENENVLCFVRTSANQRCLAVFNMTAQPQTLALDLPVERVEVLFSTHPRPEAVLEALELQPFESLILEVA